MSFFALNTAGNALQAYTEAMDVTSNNIANVNTPGASRQVAVLNEAPPIAGSPDYGTNLSDPGTLGEGSMVDSIQRIHVDSYDGLFRGATSSANYYTVEQEQLTNLQSEFGEPNNGVNTAFTTLQTSLSDLAATPTSTSVQQGVLSAANGFVTALNNASSAIENQQATVLTQATSVVSQANTLIEGIAQLNGEIRAQTAVGNNPNTYLDQRDEDIDQLSQLLPVQTSIQADGSTLVTVNGQALVNDTEAYTLAPPVVGTASDGSPEFKIGFENDPNPTNPTAIPLGSGQLGAFADLYNNKLIPYADQLNNFASAAANQINTITESGYDSEGNAGTALFQPVSATEPINAANIQVGIDETSALPISFATTAAISTTATAPNGNLLAPQPLNAANTTVDIAAQLDGNQDLNNPPPAASAGPPAVPAGVQGALTVTVNGVAQYFYYSTNPSVTPTAIAGDGAVPADAAGNAQSISDFIASFNAAQLGVTASYNTTGQTIVFTRDPTNTSLAAQAAQGTNANSPTFEISDSNLPASPPAAAPDTTQGVAATSLLGVLGASGINGQTIGTDAYGTDDSGVANALVSLFSKPVGIGYLQTTAGTVTGTVPGSLTITATTPAEAAQYRTVQVGQELTFISATTGVEQTVTVTGVNTDTGSITASGFTSAVATGDAFTTTPTQTLGTAYSSLVSQMALDLSTASTASTTQTNLASTINTSRQAVDGINLDEETQNLLQYQSAYQAAAQTISAINDMLQTAISIISTTA
jgi:flagellar hook-associated protein 1 FlgK